MTATRTCLMCNKPFPSRGPENRRCERCRETMRCSPERYVEPVMAALNWRTKREDDGCGRTRPRRER